VQQGFVGPVREPLAAAGGPVRDLCAREVLALAPLAVFIVWIGVAPGFFLDRMAPTLDALVRPALRAADASHRYSEFAAPRPGVAAEPKLNPEP